MLCALNLCQFMLLSLRISRFHPELATRVVFLRGAFLRGAETVPMHEGEPFTGGFRGVVFLVFDYGVGREELGDVG